MTTDHSDNGGDELAPPPPTYEDTVSGSTASLRVASAPQSDTTTSAGPTIPASSPPLSVVGTAVPKRSTSPPNDAHRAVAPLTHSSTNGSFSGTYVVFLGESKSAPDVNLSSTNGGISTTLYLKGSPPGRSAEVVAKTTNGRMAVAVPSRESAVNVQAKGSNGKITVHVPRDFEGLISLRTTNGTKKISPELQARAVIVPSDSGDSKTITYRIRREDEHATGPSAPVERPPAAFDSMTDSGFPKDKKEPLGSTTASTVGGSTTKDAWMSGEPGPDRVKCETTNGTIRVYYWGEEIPEVEESKSSCVLM